MSHDDTIGVGIDVAAKKFDVVFSDHSAIGRAGVEQFPNDKKGIDRFLKRLEHKQAEGLLIERICLEATGVYHRRLVDRLFVERLPVAAVNPRQPRNFALAKNKLAKTDAIDAQTLAELAVTSASRARCVHHWASRRPKEKP